MGIRRLLSHLDQYGERLVIAPEAKLSSKEPPSIAVIDGPSLAYHVYNICISGSNNTPSYHQIGQAAIQWLQMLTRYGFEIRAIYFDGALPATKRQERLARLTDAANKLQSSKASTPAGFATSNSLPSAASIQTIAAVPFMVNAIIGALLDNPEIASHVHVVPGEADAFCAAEAKRTRSVTIISNDSDLLVHDIGADSSVMLLNYVLESQTDDTPTLQAKVFRPEEIARRMNVASLSVFAYTLSQDPHRSLPQLLEQTRSADTSSSGYSHFLSSYQPQHTSTYKQSSEPHCDPRWRSVLQKLDPRVSEIIDQIDVSLPKRDPHHATKIADTAAQPVMTYLPPLIEDPDRASAWTMARSIRRLAYSIASLLDAHHPVDIQEWHRRGTRVSALPVELLTNEEIVSASAELTLQIETASIPLVELGANLQWRVRAAHLLEAACIANDKSLANTQSLASAVLHKRVPMTWNQIHLTAQIQAILYSLRMLHQLLQVILAYLECYGPEALSLPQGLDTLAAVLEPLPSITGMFDAPQSPYDAATERRVCESLNAIVQPRDDQGADDDFLAAVKRRRKRKKSPLGSHADTVRQKAQSSNPFAALDVDD